MSEFIDFHDVGLWLCLIVPGVAMLIWLVVNLLRVDVISVTPVDPAAEVEPVTLDRLARHAIEPLGDAITVLGCSLTAGHAPGEEPPAPISLPTPIRRITEARDFITLADKMHQLSELTSRMLEKKRALAGVSSAALALAVGESTPSKPYLSFALGGEPFVISTSNIGVVVEGSQLTTKPAIASNRRSAIRVGNTLVPVIDLGTHLVGRPVKMSWSTCVIVLEVVNGDRKQMIGMAVDSIGGVLRAAPAQIDPSTLVDGTLRDDFILGALTINNQTHTLLSIEQGLAANAFVLPRSLTQPVIQESPPI